VYQPLNVYPSFVGVAHNVIDGFDHHCAVIVIFPIAHDTIFNCVFGDILLTGALFVVIDHVEVFALVWAPGAVLHPAVSYDTINGFASFVAGSTLV
jgi:hypothetical protein